MVGGTSILTGALETLDLQELFTLRRASKSAGSWRCWIINHANSTGSRLKEKPRSIVSLARRRVF
jgi:hypothetical protein